jgi:demethylmenaquinone methyltransferase / 2-methoxy-6-polyprenyl-1,4-benzoquinol methylase
MPKLKKSATPDHAALNPEADWFGFAPVAAHDKTNRVHAVFASVAARYDVMNDLMSLGIHRRWKATLVRLMAPRGGEQILDLAGGTGDIAQRLQQRAGGQCAITICDYNATMLEHGRDRAINSGRWNAYNWVVGDAASLPFPDNSFDKLCISFGLRNVTRIDTALGEIVRVLKPGGQFYCLEFSPGVAAPLKKLYEAYSFTLLPWLGEVVGKDRAAYQYLAESIRQFPTQPVLAARMQQAGLAQCRWVDLSGGITVIHHGWKF